MGTGRGAHGHAARAGVSGRTVAGIRCNARSIVLTRRLAHGLALGEVIGPHLVACLAAAAERPWMVHAHLLATAICKVSAFINIQAAPPVRGQLPAGSAATVQVALGPYGAAVVATSVTELTRRHIDTAEVVGV